MTTLNPNRPDTIAPTDRGPLSRPWEIGYPIGSQTYAGQPPWPEFTDFSPAREGVAWDGWGRLYAEEQWEEFYRRGYSHFLFADAPDIYNALQQIGTDFIILNYFKTTADFYRDGMVSELPTLTGNNRELQAFLDGIYDPIMDAYYKMVSNWSVKAKFSWALNLRSTGPEPSAVDPSFHWYIRDRFEHTKTVAHLLAERWYQTNSWLDYHALKGITDLKTIQPPNRIRLVEWDPMGNVTGRPIQRVQVRELMGGIIGKAIANAPAVGIAGIWAEGDGHSTFADIATIVKALITRTSLNHVTLNAASKYIQWQPANAHDPAEQRKTAMQGQRGFEYLQGVQDEDQPPMFVSPDLTVHADSIVERDYLMTALFHVSGVPQDAFGSTDKRVVSGVAVEQLHFTAQTRINRARHQSERLFRAMIDAWPGRPAGEIGIGWPEDPFVPKSVRRKDILAEYTAGMYDLLTSLLRMGEDPESAKAIVEAVEATKDRDAKRQADMKAAQGEPDNA